MRDMDILRSQFARRTLRHRTQSELRRRERREAAAATQAGGRASKEDRSPTARQHQPSRLPPGEKAGIAGHLPHFSKYPFGRFKQWKVDIGADVEDADLQRRLAIRLLQE